MLAGRHPEFRGNCWLILMVFQPKFCNSEEIIYAITEIGVYYGLCLDMGRDGAFAATPPYTDQCYILYITDVAVYRHAASGLCMDVGEDSHLILSTDCHTTFLWEDSLMDLGSGNSVQAAVRAAPIGSPLVVSNT